MIRISNVNNYPFYEFIHVETGKAIENVFDFRIHEPRPGEPTLATITVFAEVDIITGDLVERSKEEQQAADLRASMLALANRTKRPKAPTIHVHPGGVDLDTIANEVAKRIKQAVIRADARVTGGHDQ